MADDGWKQALLDQRPDMPSSPLEDEENGDGAALIALMAESGGRCWYCGCQMTYGVGGASISREHLLPRARGGGNDTGNVVGACRACNTRKQARTVDEYRAALSRMTGGTVTFYGERDIR